MSNAGPHNQRTAGANALLATVLQAIFILQFYWLEPFQPAIAQSDEGKGIYRVQPPLQQKEPESKLTENAVESQVLERADKALTIGKEVQAAIMTHLRDADNYDVEAFAKNDDHLNDLYDRWDANVLDWQSLVKSNPKAQQALSTARIKLRLAKLNSYKSSTIFYLCFGQPMQAAHCAKLALAMAGCRPANQNESDKIDLSEILFYQGAACLWCADYDDARPTLESSLSSSLSDYAYYYIGQLYLAKKDFAAAENWLKDARKRVSPAARGLIDQSLALAYILSKDSKAAQPCLTLARNELSETLKTFGDVDDTANNGPRALALESLGIVEALSGHYDIAEGKLSEALSGHSLSPLKMGNKLEAAQTKLWRSYCRYKLGNKSGAREDLDGAMVLVDEANHLAYLARNLDQLFNMQNVSFPPSAPAAERYAIVVGLSNFEDGRIPKLRFSAKDAADMAAFLRDEAGFAPSNIKVLLDGDATRGAILNSISDWLPSRAKSGDLVFFFVSSHGTPAYGDIGALNAVVTYDSKIDQLFSTTLPMQAILRAVRSKLTKQRSFVVLDTCYSGGLGAPDGSTSANVDPALLVNSNLQLLVSSSDANERSWESKRYKNSVFTRQLIEALEKNLSYKDFHDIFGNVQKQVEEEVASDWKSTQTPTLAGKWSGHGLATISTDPKH